MKKTQGARGSQGGQVCPVLTDKPIYGDQPLADGIDSKKQAFKSHGAEQRRTVGCNEAWRRNFFAVQRQSSFSHGPYVSLPAGDYDALRAGGFQLEPFRQQAGHNAECRTGVHKKLNVFTAPRRAGQTTFYVKQSHIRHLLENEFIVAQLTYKTNPLQVALRQAFEDRS